MVLLLKKLNYSSLTQGSFIPSMGEINAKYKQRNKLVIIAVNIRLP